MCLENTHTADFHNVTSYNRGLDHSLRLCVQTESFSLPYQFRTPIYILFKLPDPLDLTY